VSVVTHCACVLLAIQQVAILGMIIGGFVFSGIISTMAEVLQAVNLSKQAKRHKIDCVSAFIRDAHLPSNFTRAVLAFFRSAIPPA
jgi:hypothetical protein